MPFHSNTRLQARRTPLSAALAIALALSGASMPGDAWATGPQNTTFGPPSWAQARQQNASRPRLLMTSRSNQPSTAGDTTSPNPAWKQKVLAKHPEMRQRVQSWRAKHPGSIRSTPIITGNSVTRPHNATAATIPVTACDETDLRTAVTGAASGDTIDLTSLSNCTITLSTGAIPITQDELTFNGPGADELTIDANHDSSIFHSTGANGVNINAMRLTGGFAYGRSGGAVYAVNDVMLEHVTISDSGTFGYQAGGAAIFSQAGNIHLLDSVVTTTRSVGYGVTGAVTAYAGDVYLGSSRIDGNRVYAYHYGLGGGAFAGNELTAYNTTITNNQITASSAAGGGGFAYNAQFFVATISNNRVLADNAGIGGGIATSANMIVFASTVSGNQILPRDTPDMYAAGGGLYSAGVDTNPGVTSKYSTISDNHSAYFGGGIVSQNAVQLGDTTISGNVAAYGAGGVLSWNGATKVFNSTITGNVSHELEGGGLVCLGTAELQSSILFGNLAQAGNADFFSYNATTANSANNIIGDAGSLSIPADTMHADPQLGPLQNNGGFTLTHAISPGSPAIDTGNNVLPTDWDQRGEPFSRVMGSAPDIGAIEYNNDIIFINGFDS